MTIVGLAGARKSFGATEVLKGIDLASENGEFLVFVGPSGCGKSTLLRVIAGLEDLDAGDVTIGGVRVNDLSPSQRGIAMVFQSYALYPHMTVAENLAFSLKLAGTSKPEIAEAVATAAKTLDIGHLLARKPGALSGGQRQRVAIGRAIVRQPKVFLFDEPLSNLDAALRVKMRYEFAALHKALATTMIYVTHDQAEAMTLADRIVVLNDGRIEQVGRPLDLYEHPANVFVAGFIGSPRMNMMPGTVLTASDDGVTVALRSGEQLAVAVTGASIGQAVTIGIRPEGIREGAGGNAIIARVRFVEALGNTSFSHLDHAGADEPLIWQASGAVRPEMNAEVAIALPAAALHLFDERGGAFARLQPSTVANAA